MARRRRLVRNNLLDGVLPTQEVGIQYPIAVVPFDHRDPARVVAGVLHIEIVLLGDVDDMGREVYVGDYCYMTGAQIGPGIDEQISDGRGAARAVGIVLQRNAALVVHALQIMDLGPDVGSHINAGEHGALVAQQPASCVLDALPFNPGEDAVDLHRLAVDAFRAAVGIDGDAASHSQNRAVRSDALGAAGLREIAAQRYRGCEGLPIAQEQQCDGQNMKKPGRTGDSRIAHDSVLRGRNHPRVARAFPALPHPNLNLNPLRPVHGLRAIRRVEHRIDGRSLCIRAKRPPGLRHATGAAGWMIRCSKVEALAV